MELRTGESYPCLGGRCPHNVPLYREVCMDGNVPERDDIAPFHLRVRLTKDLREACCRLTNHGELLEDGGFMEFTRRERRDIRSFQDSSLGGALTQRAPTHAPGIDGRSQRVFPKEYEEAMFRSSSFLSEGIFTCPC